MWSGGVGDGERQGINLKLVRPALLRAGMQRSIQMWSLYKAVFSPLESLSEVSLICPLEPDSSSHRRGKAQYTQEVHNTNHFAANPSSEII